MMGATGLIGFPLNAMKQAMHGPEASRILLLPYDLLVGNPAAAMMMTICMTAVAAATVPNSPIRITRVITGVRAAASTSRTAHKTM